MKGFEMKTIVETFSELLLETASEALYALVVIAQLTAFTYDVATNNPTSPNDVRRDFTEEMAEEIAIAAYVAETETGIPAPELIAVAWRESRFRVNAVGDGGRSCGPTQVRWDIWSREIAWAHTEFDATGLSCQTLKDWDFAMMVSAQILLINRNTCSQQNYLAAYNGGCRRAEFRTTQGYQTRVRRTARRFQEPEMPQTINWLGSFSMTSLNEKL